MKNFSFIVVLSLFVMLAGQRAYAEANANNPVVLADDGVSLTKAELEYLISRWTSQMKSVAVADEGDRLELLNLMLANKKVAMEADKLVAQKPELGPEYRSGLEGYQRDFVLRQYRDSIDYPDFSELARETYTLERTKYAEVPETRTSSHILFSSPPGQDRTGVLAEAEDVLQQLRSGADFNAMVAEHSGEPRAAERNGKFDRWLKYGEIGVSPPYTEGLFSISAVGDYSDLVQTEFGVHIIRLDGIKEKTYKPFEEVQEKIVADLKAEYTKLEMKDFVTRFNLSEDAMINMEVIEELLAPYASKGE